MSCAILQAATAMVMAANESPEQAPQYKAEAPFETGATAKIAYMSITPKDDICVLFTDGAVKIFDTKGKEQAFFKTELKGASKAIAVDGKDIYVASTEFDRRTFKRGSAPQPEDKALVSCGVYDMSGKLAKSVPVPGVMEPSAMHVVGDKLVVADKMQNTLFIVDPKTGKSTRGPAKGIRTCCGIFDFCKGPNDTVVVANLGAFKVSTFKLSGDLASDFGKRGKSVDDFHGCCNPVSVSVLPSGAIVTVEKDPTRVKVYDKTGQKASLVQGIDEMVKGCSHIPMVTDSKGNVYLGSKMSNKIIKCVPAAAASAK